VPNEIDLSGLPLVGQDTTLGDTLTTEPRKSTKALLEGLPRETPEVLSQQYRTLKSSPAEDAKVANLSERTGIPDTVVENRIRDVERLANEPDWKSFERTAPKSAELMAKDPVLFRLARGSTDEMSRLEQLASEFKAGYFQSKASGRVASVVQANELGYLDNAPRPLTKPLELLPIKDNRPRPRPTLDQLVKTYGAPIADSVLSAIRDGGNRISTRFAGFADPNYPEVAAYNRLIAEQKIREAGKFQALANLQFQSPEVKRFLESKSLGGALSTLAESPATITTDIIAQSGYPVLQSIAGATVGGLLGPVGRVLGSFATSYDVNYNSRLTEALTEEGVNVSDPAAVMSALNNPELIARVSSRAANYAGPIAAFDSLATITAGVRLSPSVLRNSIGQTASQALFGGLGEASGQISEQGKVTSWPDVIAEGVAELPGGIIEPAAYHIVDLFRNGERAANAQVFKDQIDKFVGLAKTGKLRNDSPKKFEEVIDRLLQDNPDADVYVNANEFTKFFQSKGVNPMEIAGQLSGVAAQLPEAAARNGNLKIKASELITRLGPTEYYSGLSEILRAQPNAMSAKDAAEWQAAKQEELQTLVAKLDKERANDTEWNESARRVEDFVREQIVATGRFSREVAAKDAALHGKMAKVLASRLGIKPHEVYEKFGLRVAGSPIAPGGLQYDQNTGDLVAESPEFRRKFQGSVVVNDKGDPLLVRGEGGVYTPGASLGDPGAAYLMIKDPAVLDVETPIEGGVPLRSIPPAITANIDPNVIQDGRAPLGEVLRAAVDSGHDGLVIRQGPETRFVPAQGDQIAPAMNPGGSRLFQALSTRVPTAVAAKEDPFSDLLKADYDLILTDEKTLGKTAETLRQFNFMRPTKTSLKSDKAAVEQYIDHAKRNLLFLYDLVPKEVRERASLWYDGAHRIAKTWADRYGISEMQAAAVIAVLSPQKDWFQNISSTERIADIAFGMQDFRWDQAMTETARNILGDKSDPKMELVVGKTLGEVLDQPDLAARWVRVFDQTHNDRGYVVTTPEGGVTGVSRGKSGEPNTLAWGSYQEIGKAISILTDGRVENIFHQLGYNHKVRNFYDNIYDPNHPAGFVTIDTHAVAAELLRPVGGDSREVRLNFGTGKGATTSSVTGIRGLYPINAEAYRRAAQERGILPRQMQSIVWEAARGLFSSAKKKHQLADVDKIWEKYQKGRISLKEAQEQIVRQVGPISRPEWASFPFDDQPRPTYTGMSRDAMTEMTAPGSEAPPTPNILFEVAPDPNDKALTARWDALPLSERSRISLRVANEIVPEVLKEFSITGEVQPSLGGYNGATNPSLALVTPKSALTSQLSKALGYILAQDSVAVVSEHPFAGSDRLSAVTIELPEGAGEAQVEALYDQLWQLVDDNGNHLVGGYSVMDDQMVILNFSGVDDAQFAQMIDTTLQGEYRVNLDQVHSTLIEKEEYGYGGNRSQRQASTRKPSVETRHLDILRERALQLRDEEIARAEARAGGTFYQGGLSQKATNPPGSGGRNKQGTEGVSTPPIREDGRVELVHWGRLGGLNELDPEKHGTGISGAESRRKANNPGIWVNRTYYGIAVGQEGGYRKERTLGPHRYVTSIDPGDLYDFRKDPDGLYDGDPTRYERAIHDAGYSGYWVKDVRLGMVAAVFKPLPIESYVNERPVRYGQDPIEAPLTIPDEDPILRETLDLPGREDLRARILNDVLKDARPVEGRKPIAWVMGGGGAAGKGTLLAAMKASGAIPSEGVVHIDPDEIKQKIPEYQEIIARGDSRAASVVHEESSLLRKMAEQATIDLGADMVLDITMGNPDKGKALIRQLKDAGYEVHLVGATVPVDVAITRASLRGKRTGRYVNLDALVQAHQGFSAGFEDYAKLADSAILYDNTGEKPALVFDKGDVVNPVLYNEFRKRSNGENPNATRRLRPGEQGSSPDQKRGPEAKPNASAADSTGNLPGTVPASAEGTTGGGGSQPVTPPGNLSAGRLTQQARGSIEFPADITQAPSVINLLEGADLSTFLHETGHFFFEVYRAIASQPDAPEVIVSDMQALLEFIGVKDLDTWNKMSPEQRRKGHEKVARAFEAYLFEGKAPSPDLQDLFRTFRQWLIEVYKSLINLNVKLTSEVRGVFSRMLATEEEIRAVEALRQYEPLFESLEQSGMSPGDWAEYQKSLREATDAANEELQTRSLRDMKWLSRAKSREIKRLQKDAAAKRKAVRAEAEAEVYATPLYAARRFLTHGDVDLPTPNQKSRRLAEEISLGPHKLSKTALVEMYGNGPAAPWRYLSTGKYGLMAKEGLHPNELADLFGFDSGDALVRHLLEAPSPETVIEELTDKMMLERYGDITSPEVLDQMADEAIHNEARIRALRTELRALDRIVNARGDTGLTDARGRKITFNIFDKAAREFVARAIGRKKVRDAGLTGEYSVAETRAGKAVFDALKKGDLVAAADNKRAQVLNAYFFRAATKAKSEIDRTLRYLKKFDNPGTRKNLSADYLDQIDQLLERVDLRKATRKDVERRKSLAEWIAAQEEMGFTPAIPPELVEETKKTHYTDLTLEEFRGLRDAVKSIEHLGRLKKKLLTAADKREFDAAIDSAVASIAENAKKVRPQEIETDTPKGRLRRGVEQFIAMHRKLSEILRQMDGEKDGGEMWSLLMLPLNKAMDHEAVMREEATIKVNKLFTDLKKRGRLYQKEYIPEINASLSKMGRIMVALNLGNDTNRARLTQGYGWSPKQIEAITRPLTKEDWDFVQGIWDLLESYWPEIVAKEKRVSGVAPEKVQATPVVTPYGEYRGGYFPIKYDINQSPKAHQDATAEAAKQAMRGAYARATTRRGHLKSRVDEVHRPIKLSFSVIFEHLGQVIHDLALHEYLIDQARILNDSRMKDAIVTHYGPEIYRQITDTMTAVAAGDVPVTQVHERVANWLRAGSSIAAMGWKLSTAMLQPVGITQSIQRIGAKWVFRGVKHALTDAAHLENTYAWISGKSDMMRLRGKTMQREINEIRNKIEKEGWFQDQLDRAARALGAEHAPDIKESYFWLLVKMQLVTVDIPTWLGAYEKAMSAGESDARAVAIADQAVLDAQGGGQIKDLAAVQRGSPWWKLWTNFYSFFNTSFNRLYNSAARADLKRPASIGRLAVDVFLVLTLPSALSTLLHEMWRNECDGEDECIAKKIAKDQVSYALGIFVGLREIEAAFQPYGYQGPAGARIISEVSNLGRQAAQGELDEALLRAANKSGGILFHYPAGQIDATVRGIESIATGKTDNLRAVLFGPPK